MGLDMYLEGRKYLIEDYEHRSNNVNEDGFRVKEMTLELGYWRKEPNLHGYIVQEFANGLDECQKIELCVEDLEQIRDAVRDRKLIPTSGFFFGTSSDPNSNDPQEREWGLEFERNTIEIFDKAIAWLKVKDDNKHRIRYVVYQASW